MTPGQEGMIQKKDLDKIISAHGLNIPSSRINRQVDNNIDVDNISPEAPQGVNLPPGMRMPEVIPEGFDLSSVEPQEDGQFCVFKKLSLEGIEKIPVQQCVHKVDTQCYLSYVTQYTPTTEDVCSDNYRKKCYIEYTKTAVTETIEKCIIPMERICSPPKYGEVPNEVCQTQYETSCVTRYKDTPVVENVEECNKVYKKTCEDVLDTEYGAEPKQICSNKPVEECNTVSKTVYKKLPDTVCERLPFEACAPDNCEFVPGPAECHNNTVDIGIDAPEEVCDLQPQKMCKQVYRLVPKLFPQEICEEVPREVCYTSLKNPRKVTTPLLTKWCFTPEPIEEEEPVPVYKPKPKSYGPPPPLYKPKPKNYGLPPPPPPPVYHAPVPVPVYPQPLPHHPLVHPHPPSYPPPPPPGYPPVVPPPKKYGFKLLPTPPPFLPPHSTGHSPASNDIPDFSENLLNNTPDPVFVFQDPTSNVV